VAGATENIFDILL